MELVLPVTPSSYQWTHEATIGTVTVDQLGNPNFFDGKRMGSTTLHDYFPPTRAYPFLSPGTEINPWLYLEQLERWVGRGTVMRWLVSGTPVDAAVLLEGVTYREQGDTNDLYTDITLRRYTRPETPVLPTESSVSGTGMATSRNSVAGTATAKTYTVASGDTLWGICRWCYRDGFLIWRLVTANGIANASLARPGQVFTILPLTQLPAAAAGPPSAKIAAATKVREVKEEESETAHLVPWVPESTMKSPAGLELDKITSGGSLWWSIKW